MPEIEIKKFTQLRWLGDWGTQFMLLAYSLQNSDLGQILNRQDPMQELYTIYVEVNKAKDAEMAERIIR